MLFILNLLSCTSLLCIILSFMVVALKDAYTFTNILVYEFTDSLNYLLINKKSQLLTYFAVLITLRSTFCRMLHLSWYSFFFSILNNFTCTRQRVSITNTTFMSRRYPLNNSDVIAMINYFYHIDTEFRTVQRQCACFNKAGR